MPIEIQASLCEAELRVYFSPVQDKDINRYFADIRKRLDRVENTQPGELVLGSELDKRLTKISDSASNIQSGLNVIGERVNNHVKFVWTSVAALFVICGFFSTVLYKQNGSLSRIEGALPSLRLEETTSGKLNEQKVMKAQQIVAESMRSGAFISPQVLQQVGQTFVSVAGNPQSNLAPVAWKAVNDFLNYRSVLNAANTASRFVGTPNQQSVPSNPTKLEQGARHRSGSQAARRSSQ